MITQDRLKEIAKYEDGCLVWRKTGTGRRSKYLGGTECAYRRCRIGNERYMVHHLVWLYHNGKLPKNQIDHTDGDTTNNRIENLRDVSQYKNTRNRKLSSNNTSGYNGVQRRKGRNIWIAVVYTGNNKTITKTFKDVHEAGKWQKETSLLYGYEKEHGVRN